MKNQTNGGSGSPALPCSSSFDGVRREPVDRAAAMMFAPGVKAPEANMGTMLHWETCPPIHTKQMVLQIHRASGEDLTGRRCGRMVVVGLAREIPARWIMRCDCGDFEPRTAKAVKNPNNMGDCCTACRKVAEAKRAHEFHTTGRNVAERFPMNLESEAAKMHLQAFFARSNREKEHAQFFVSRESQAIEDAKLLSDLMESLGGEPMASTNLKTP